MARFVLLDTGVIGLLCTSSAIDSKSCRAWLDELVTRRTIVVVPEVADYEIRRELVRLVSNPKTKKSSRLDAIDKTARLEALRDDLVVADVTGAAWRKATEFWAIVRNAGRPTADERELDADAILAAVAVTIAPPGSLVVIATTNVGHLERFPGVTAKPWTHIE